MSSRKLVFFGVLNANLGAGGIENYDRGAADGNRAETPSLSKFSESCARDMTGFGLIVEFT